MPQIFLNNPTDKEIKLRNMKLNSLKCITVLLMFEVTQCVRESKINKFAKSRRRRYVSFPEGSSFALTICDTVSTIMGSGIYYQGINWGTGWALPNHTSVLDIVTENKHKRKRKQRRDVYSKMENILEAMGYDGPSCIYRALCETPRKFKRKSTKLIEELLRIFFKFPLQKMSDDEIDHKFYHEAHRIGRDVEQQDCADIYPDCTISLIDLALGYYNI